MAAPVSTTTASTVETIIAAAWVTITSRRVSKRSTIEPAKSPSTVYGAKRQNARAPTARGDGESWTTSQASAMFCIHEPASETT